MKLLLKISFIGTEYEGFQCQKSGRAVQNVLTAAAERVFGLPCNVTGSSRTDAGVHAQGFTVTVSPKDGRENWCTVPVGKVHRAFAPHLPSDISVVGAAAVDDSFHPRYNARGKEYVYKIYDGKTDDPFLFGRTMRRKIPVTEAGLSRMKEAARHFVGRQDFRAFMASGSKITDCTREVYCARVERDGDVITFTVCADGFLYNMVRIMAGTLLDCAAGKFEPEDVKTIIENKNREGAGFTAPPEGLYLSRVLYDEEIEFLAD